MSTVMGIDLSLTSTGVVVLNEAGDVVANTAITSPASGPLLVDRMARYHKIVQSVLELVAANSPSVVCVEHYVTGGAGGGVFERIELGCLVRKMLLSSNVGQIYEVPPTTLKKWATGKGAFKGGGKVPLIVALVSRWKVEFLTDDEYDGYALARMAHQIAGFSEPTVDHMREAIGVAVNGKPKKPKKSRKKTDG